uniref:Orf100b n=1 Tax=Batis maritima TaxID=4436 RepID=A0A068BE58_BATMA|nr:orf100b [Batis maritima]AIC83356.1 orf100b [Batis maritima]
MKVKKGLVLRFRMRTAKVLAVVGLPPKTAPIGHEAFLVLLFCISGLRPAQTKSVRDYSDRAGNKAPTSADFDSSPHHSPYRGHQHGEVNASTTASPSING